MVRIRTLIERMKSPSLEHDILYIEAYNFINNRIRDIEHGIQKRHLGKKQYLLEPIGKDVPWNRKLGKKIIEIIRLSFPQFDQFRIELFFKGQNYVNLRFDWSHIDFD